MEFFSTNGNSVAELRWQSASVAKSIIPPANLSHTPFPALVWDFGIAEPGSISSRIENRLANTGNYALERIRLARVDLRKSVSETISEIANLLTDPETPFGVTLGASQLSMPGSRYHFISLREFT